MAEQVQMWRSDAGTVFNTEFEALSDDLRAMFEAATGNPAIATKAVTHFTSNRSFDTLANLAKRLQDSQPAPPPMPAADMPRFDDTELAPNPRCPKCSYYHPGDADCGHDAER